MFWGLIMEPGKCYSQKVKYSFHVSMAALDISNSANEPAQVMCLFDGRNYLLCTLNGQDKLQCSLDLDFEAGSRVAFATNGNAHVHLTGYLLNPEEGNFLNEDNEEEEVEEEEASVSKKEKKRLIKKESAEQPPNKKTKITKSKLANAEAEEEDDTSDSDFDLDTLTNEDEEASDEEEAEEEEDDEDASSLSGEEVEDESEEEEQEKPKQNGVAKTKTNFQQKTNKEQKQQEKVPKGKPAKQEEKRQQKPKKAILKGGVQIEDLREGSGDPAKEGKVVSVYYEGRLRSNNKLFDSTTRGPGFKFRLGKGEVIKGWDIGLVGMKAGGKRRITCPAKVAYGATGSPPVIPPNATLVFDVELKKIG